MTTSFTFNQAPLNALDSGTFCIFPVSSRPSQTAVVSSDVNSISGFIPVILTGRNLTSTGWFFNPFEFPAFTYTTDTVGYVISKLVGSSPSPGDRLVLYSGYGNSLGEDITLPPNSFANRFPIDPVRGLLERIDNFLYTSTAAASPAAAPGVFPNGLVYLAGTNNNTIAFANPMAPAVPGNSRMYAWRNTDGSTHSGLYDRTLGNEGATDHIVDMRLNKIRPGTVVMRTNSAATNVVISGSNTIEPLSITAGTANAIAGNNNLWTPISTPANLASGVWNSIQCTDSQTFWSYLRISSNNAANWLSGIEYMASSYQSRTQNMVP